MTQKYVDGLPLARQEKIWVREGISLSRATMANWVIQCSEVWLKPLYRHMKQELLTHSVIHADETVVQVLKEDGIDVVAVNSLAFQRYCELASLISKPLTVVTDNDGNAVAVRKRYEKYTGLVTLCV